MRWLAALVIYFSCLLSAFAGWSIFVDNHVGYHTLKIGPSLYVTGMDIAPSGSPIANTALVRTDQYGCYLGTSTASPLTWVQLMTVQAMPALSVTDSAGTPLGGGCDEAVIDPENTSTFLLAFNGNLYKSTNRGTTFSTTGYPTQPGSLSPAQNQSAKSLRPTVAVDPNNSSVVYASTPAQGSQFSHDGATTFATVAGTFAGIYLPNNFTGDETAGTDSTSISTCTGIVSFSNNSGSFNFTGGDMQHVEVWETSNPQNSMFGTVHAASGTTFSLTVMSNFGTCSHSDWTVGKETSTSSPNVVPGGHIYAFDKHGGTTTVAGQTRTKNVYTCTYGVGVFASADGGQTWAAAGSGGPKRCLQMVVDPNGVLWFVAYADLSTNNLWNYTPGTTDQNGTWAQSTITNQAGSVAIGPSCSSEATCQIAVAGNDNVYYYTVNGGDLNSGSWNTKSSQTFLSPTVGWMAPWQSNFGFFGIGAIAFDSTGNLFWTDEGVWTTTPSTSGSTATFTQQGVGIEGIEGASIISPTSGVMLVAGFDVGILYSNNFNAFPSAATGAEQYAPGLNRAYSLDYSGSLVGSVADNTAGYGGGGTYSGYSGSGTGYGAIAANWTKFTVPSGISTGCSGAGCHAGCIAVSGAGNFMWAPTDGSGGNVAPLYSNDGGSTWTSINVSGVTGGWPWAGFLAIQKGCTGDKNNNNTFFFYNWNTGSGSPADAIIRCVGLTCAIQSRPGLSFSQFVPIIQTVPGQNHYVFLSDGFDTPPSSTQGEFDYYPDDGVTKHTIANVTGVSAFGFSAPFPPHTFNTIWFAGWYSGVYGIWRCKTFDTDQCSVSADWTKTIDYPNGWPLPVLDLAGDPSIPQQVYGVTGSGAFWGYIN